MFRGRSTLGTGIANVWGAHRGRLQPPGGGDAILWAPFVVPQNEFEVNGGILAIGNPQGVRA